MTITVVTPEHGTFDFPEADNWDINSEEGAEGSLWVGKDGEGSAHFAKGSWVLVYETKDEPVDLDEPLGQVVPRPLRQWKTLAEVPIAVTVTDQDGDLYEYQGAWIWQKAPLAPLRTGELPRWAEEYGPFTEVVE